MLKATLYFLGIPLLILVSAALAQQVSNPNNGGGAGGGGVTVSAGSATYSVGTPIYFTRGGAADGQGSWLVR